MISTINSQLFVCLKRHPSGWRFLFKPNKGKYLFGIKKYIYICDQQTIEIVEDSNFYQRVIHPESTFKIVTTSIHFVEGSPFYVVDSRTFSSFLVHRLIVSIN